MKINLHIERLVLDHLPVNVGEGARVQSALVADLTQRLQRDGLRGDASVGRAIANVRPPAIQITNNMSGKNLGRKISKAVYRGVKQ